MGTSKYFILLDAGRRDKETNGLISIKSYGSETAIPLNQNLAWPHSEAVKEISFGEPNLPSKPPNIHRQTSSMNSFCSDVTMDQSRNVYSDLSGTYNYNADSKKVTFELKLNTTNPNEGNKPPIQMIVLGFSDDDEWGEDLIISCDTHPHISAFGNWKVKLFGV